MTKQALSALFLPFLLAANSASAQIMGDSLYQPVTDKKFVRGCTRDGLLVSVQGQVLYIEASLVTRGIDSKTAAEAENYRLATRQIIGKTIGQLHSMDFKEAWNNMISLSQSNSYGPGINEIKDRLNKHATGAFRYNILHYAIRKEPRCIRDDGRILRSPLQDMP